MKHSEQFREEYNSYHREWRAKNKERVSEINRRYRKKQAAKKREEAQNEQTATN